MPPRLQAIKVAREEDMLSQIGKDGHYFDLVDFSRVRTFHIPVSTTLLSFKEQLAEEFRTQVQSQRLWLWAKRQNGTYRPSRALSSQEEKLPVGGLKESSGRIAHELDLLLEDRNRYPLSSPNLLGKEDSLLFLKLYDPGHMQLRYVKTLFVKASSRPSDILPLLRSLAGFAAHEEIELYEEIKFQPFVMCEPIDIQMTFKHGQIETGDIICYQKIPKPLHKYSYVRDFLQHTYDQKEVKRKVHALEEEVVAYLQKEANTECDKLKQERDIAVRRVDELRNLKNWQAILEFSINDLEQATEHFSDANKIGASEYGRVYKGIIHKITVAIKLSNSQSLFRREVSILREGRHPNIVTIAGVCSEACAIVYEWLPNGNLEDNMVYTNDSPPLLWHRRAQIIAEVCSALLYLHSNKPNALVHGYLRPCNILLDGDYRSKLCNFGSPNPFLEPDACAANLTVRLPYLDPEFLTTGELTPLSDVYSLGVIILRLLTGLPPLSIAKKVAAALESDSLHTLIDNSAGDWPYTQAKQLALIALSCVEMSKEKRPDLLTKVWAVVEPMIKSPPPAASWPYLEPASDGSRAPAHFVCPILMEIMNDPQVASDGFTYEAEAIRRWLDGGSDRSPMTNLALPNRDLVPNHALRSCIQEYLKLQEGQSLTRSS